MAMRNIVTGLLLALCVCGCTSRQGQLAPENPAPIAQCEEPAHPVRDHVRGLAEGCAFVIFHPVLALAYALGAVPKC